MILHLIMNFWNMYQKNFQRLKFVGISQEVMKNLTSIFIFNDLDRHFNTCGYVFCGLVTDQICNSSASQKNKSKMKIPFQNIDGRVVVNALVEIPERILNMFPVSTDGEESTIDIPHVKPNTFTRVFADGAVCFPEEDKLPIPDAKSNGIYVEKPSGKVAYIALVLTDLGFKRRGPAKWWNPIFGEDNEQNWMDFDMKTDELYVLIPKLFRSAYVQGQRKVRFDIRKALDISLI
jgi:hypothetical protein